jgi:hypothetical protein
VLKILFATVGLVLILGFIVGSLVDFESFRTLPGTPPVVGRSDIKISRTVIADGLQGQKCVHAMVHNASELMCDMLRLSLVFRDSIGSPVGNQRDSLTKLKAGEHRMVQICADSNIFRPDFRLAVETAVFDQRLERSK